METAVSPRPATTDVLKQMLAIESASYPTPWQVEHFESELAKPFARVLVLTDDETDRLLAGYIIYWVHAEEVSLLNITVSPNWRGFGFAQKLMTVMVNEAVRDEIPKIVLEVRPSNKSAIRLYEKFGFELMHERKQFYQNGESAYVMQLKTSDLSGIIQ